MGEHADSTVKIAALFPGQGAQYAGMTKELVENFPWVRERFEEASDAISLDLMRLTLDGPDSDLQLTANAQPTILATSYCWYQVAVREYGLRPVAGAGHSLGEYSALLSAGAMTLTEAVKAVRTRGELMQSAVPVGKGKMVALIGPSVEQAQALCEKATEGDSVVVPANLNAPGQIVLAGHTAAVERAEKLASDHGARKVVPLKVSAPFHSPLMKVVAEKLLPTLQAIGWRDLEFPVAFNVDGILKAEANCAELLFQQVDHSVQWIRCTESLSHSGVSHYVEMGPGKVLAGLVKRILSQPKVTSIDGVSDFRAIPDFLKS